MPRAAMLRRGGSRLAARRLPVLTADKMRVTSGTGTRAGYKYSIWLIISSAVVLPMKAAIRRIFSPTEQRWSGRTMMSA